MSENRKPFETYAHYKIGKGFATLAVSVDEGEARVGVSYCHPRDGINKSFGRSVAARRRDASSTFGFEFKRNQQKLGDQLRDEFESFIVEAGAASHILKNLESKEIRVGAPPWVIHSLNREIRSRNRLIAAIDAADSASCSCC